MEFTWMVFVGVTIVIVLMMIYYAVMTNLKNEARQTAYDSINNLQRYLKNLTKEFQDTQAYSSDIPQILVWVTVKVNKKLKRVDAILIEINRNLDTRLSSDLTKLNATTSLHEIRSITRFYNSQHNLCDQAGELLIEVAHDVGKIKKGRRLS